MEMCIPELTNKETTITIAIPVIIALISLYLGILLTDIVGYLLVTIAVTMLLLLLIPNSRRLTRYIILVGILTIVIMVFVDITIPYLLFKQVNEVFGIQLPVITSSIVFALLAYYFTLLYIATRRVIN